MLNTPCTSRSGFTLIELLVVIAILALLSVLAVPGFMHGQRLLGLAGTAKETAQLARLAQSYSQKGLRTTADASYYGLLISPAARTVSLVQVPNKYYLGIGADSRPTWQPTITDVPAERSGTYVVSPQYAPTTAVPASLAAGGATGAFRGQLLSIPSYVDAMQLTVGGAATTADTLVLFTDPFGQAIIDDNNTRNGLANAPEAQLAYSYAGVTRTVRVHAATGLVEIE